MESCSRKKLLNEPRLEEVRMRERSFAALAGPSLSNPEPRLYP
jgi:hypothetical protein